MERLSDTAIEIINELHTERLDYYSEYIPLIDAANRLSAYEDTGLDPEEIIGLKNTCEQLIGINDSLFKANQEMGKDLAEWKKALMISRAPQSWCYVEELKGGEG